MSTCSQATELMGSFVRAVKLCYGLWSGSSDPPKIDGDALRAHLGLAGTALERLETIFRAERILQSGSSGYPDGKWDFTVSDDVRKFKDIQTIDDYLDIQAEFMVPIYTLIQAGFLDVMGRAIPAPESNDPVSNSVSATWVFEDIVASETLNTKLGNAAWTQLLGQHDEVVTRTASSFWWRY